MKEVRRLDKPLTEFFLDVKITCDRPGAMFYLDVKADFGSAPPRHARLTLLKSRYEAMLPVLLVDQGVAAEKGVALELDPSTERVIFWVATEGEPAVPEKLAASLQVRKPPAEEARDALDSLRLPTVKLLVKEGLAPALRRLAAEPFATLGEIMETDDLGRKIYLLGRLADVRADVRLLEAAVRDIELCEHTVPGFMRLVFPQLCLSDPVHASLVVFHPASPPYLVNQSLAVALEHAGTPADAGEYPWSELARAAVLILCRRARQLLDDDLEALALGGAPDRQRLLEDLARWAQAKPLRAAPELPGPIDACLRVVAGKDARAAEQAALELLTHCGFIGISAELG